MTFMKIKTWPEGLVAKPKTFNNNVQPVTITVTMSGQIERVVQAYKTLSKIPSIVEARLNNTGTKISSIWSVRNIDKGKNSKYAVDYLLNADFKVFAKSDFGVDISTEVLTAVSPNETYKAVIREEINGKDNKFFLEVWSKNCLSHSIDLTSLDIHGKVYADAEFSSLDWSPDEKSLIYIAEQKPIKFESYIKRKPNENESNGDKKVTPGEEYIYKPDWGEQLVGKKHSVIVKCDIETETLTILDEIPDNMCPGQVKFTPDGLGVVGMAWKANDLSRLGLIFCTNRESQIFCLTFDGVFRWLSRSMYAVRSPRISPRGDIVWLQRTVNGPHHSCLQIVKIHKQELDKIMKTKLENSRIVPTILLDIVEKQMDIKNGTFYGMYGTSLPQKCWSGDRLLFSTQTQNEINSYVLDTESNIITNISLKSAGSTSVLCVSGDTVLASYSNVKTPGQLYVAKLPERGLEASVEWVRVSEPHHVPELSDALVDYMYLKHPACDEDVDSFTCILVNSVEKRPLMLWPHGGPHSAFSNVYSLETALFYLIGFAIVQINYRGSIGAGNQSVGFLPGKIGTSDVLDCKLATDEAMKLCAIDEERVCLYGGSHGGFLVTHLSGQYPELFKAVVSRNPVINCSSMAGVTDIPDWCYIETGLIYDESGEVLNEDVVAMRRRSPIVYVHNVKAPTAVMLGSNDRRVPYYQGLEYARRLNANGVNTKVYLYEDNHSLSSLSVEIDNLINAAKWFLTHLT